MKKLLLVHLAALTTAVFVFGGSAAFAATKLSAVSVSTVTPDAKSEAKLSGVLTDADLMPVKQTIQKTVKKPAIKTVKPIAKKVANKTVPAAKKTLKVKTAKKGVKKVTVKASAYHAVPGPDTSRVVSGSTAAFRPAVQKAAVKTTSSAKTASSSVSSDAAIPVVDDDTIDDEFLDILAGAVQREIVGTNATPLPKYYEAVKAQAVASHSYMEYTKSRTGSYPAMPYATPSDTTLSLVRQVYHKLVYYSGSVIDAVYHAASGGHTQSSSYVWSSDLPYLRGVTSSYDGYARTYTISADDLADKLSAAGISVNGSADTWFDLGHATKTDGGFINVIDVCGTPVTGRALRESILGTSNLMSAKITNISYDGENVTFSTMGYGHGVGMSQIGALGYSANNGWDYATILKHYYSGTTVR